MKKFGGKKVSLSAVMTFLVVAVVFVASSVSVGISIRNYKNFVEQNAITSSDQAVIQMRNMVSNYTEDMSTIMGTICENIEKENDVKNDFFDGLFLIRQEVESVMVYSMDGELLEYWADGKGLKENIKKNLSYERFNGTGFHISAPHVQNMFSNHYPWVVTISEKKQTQSGEWIQISMDIRFSNISVCVDEVGIGTHGYCFIMDQKGNIVYHPQQQLIYAGLKSEETDEIYMSEDGAFTKDGIIYTMRTLENYEWRIVGVSYVEELITSKVWEMIPIVLSLFFLVVITTAIASIVLANMFSKPAKKLALAMRNFENEGESFTFQAVEGSYEIDELSTSFGHMVVRIQELMERVRQEEISLRKTELNALQAQINPHFLYNTLDSIAWMCEEGRNKEAVEMVNALAKLFRISISKGHELITIEREVVHAQSYLQIQKFRYKNQFSYIFEVEDSCKEYLCNKITLQPLIENAIYHGLDMSEHGEIHVAVYEKDDDIIMTVTDNGIGMEQSQCESILKTDSNSNNGIGIKNVNDRIRIYFGEKYGLSITSELDEGTRIEIRIPKIMEEEQGV